MVVVYVLEPADLVVKPSVAYSALLLNIHDHLTCLYV